MNVTNPPH